MDNYNIRLSEYWRGTLDPQQQEEVEAWIKASPEHRETAIKFCRLEQYATEYALLQSEDETELRRQADCNVAAPRHPSFNKRRWIWIFSTAAALVLAVGSLWLSLRQPVEIAQEVELSFRTSSGEVAYYVLPDGTKVWLNSNSTLYCPESFKKKTREVRLEGEAFFDVMSDKAHPFVVRTSNCLVKVLGTQFDVDAYPDICSDFHTTLVSGRVEMSLGKGGHRRSATLVPGQRFSYNAENDLASVSYVDAESLTSWRTGCITFCHTSLKDVLTLIGNNFGIRFIINNASLLNDTYTGTFDHQPLEVILSTLEQVTVLHFKPLVVTEEDVYPRFIVY